MQNFVTFCRNLKRTWLFLPKSEENLNSKLLKIEHCWLSKSNHFCFLIYTQIIAIYDLKLHSSLYIYLYLYIRKMNFESNNLKPKTWGQLWCRMEISEPCLQKWCTHPTHPYMQTATTDSLCHSPNYCIHISMPFKMLSMVSAIKIGKIIITKLEENTQFHPFLSWEVNLTSHNNLYFNSKSYRLWWWISVTFPAKKKKRLLKSGPFWCLHFIFRSKALDT